MTSAQQAGFDAWLVKTYLACWKPARQPADADVYVAQVRLAYNPDGSLVEAREARQPAVRPGSQAAGQERHGRGPELQPASCAGAISPVL